MSKSIVSITASDLRTFLNADPKRLAALSPEARRTVEADANGRFPKGRLHKEAIALNNKRRPGKVYSTGNTLAAVNQAKAEALTLRVAAFNADFQVGARGPLPKEFVQSLSKG